MAALISRHYYTSYNVTEETIKEMMLVAKHHGDNDQVLDYQVMVIMIRSLITRSLLPRTRLADYRHSIYTLILALIEKQFLVLILPSSNKLQLQLG